MQIKKCSTTHKENERQTPHDHLIDEEKATDKIQHLSIIKALKKPGMEEKYLTIMKAIYDIT
jgi:hypothetical protein